MSPAGNRPCSLRARSSVRLRTSRRAGTGAEGGAAPRPACARAATGSSPCGARRLVSSEGRILQSGDPAICRRRGDGHRDRAAPHVCTSTPAPGFVHRFSPRAKSCTNRRAAVGEEVGVRVPGARAAGVTGRARAAGVSRPTPPRGCRSRPVPAQAGQALIAVAAHIPQTSALPDDAPQARSSTAAVAAARGSPACSAASTAAPASGSSPRSAQRR
jgi:hypothetical protein